MIRAIRAAHGFVRGAKEILCTRRMLGGKKKPKGVFSSENTNASTGKKEVWCIPKSLLSREKKGKTYTPKSLPGVCGRPLRTALVYKFCPPKCEAPVDDHPLSGGNLRKPGFRSHECTSGLGPHVSLDSREGLSRSPEEIHFETLTRF